MSERTRESELKDAESWACCHWVADTINARYDLRELKVELNSARAELLDAAETKRQLEAEANRKIVLAFYFTDDGRISDICERDDDGDPCDTEIEATGLIEHVEQLVLRAECAESRNADANARNSELATERDRLAIALSNISGALCDAATVPVPDDPMGYADAVRAITAERDKYRIALESFTPGGSEYAGDLDRCASVIRERLNREHAHVLRAVKERKQVEAERDRLAAELKKEQARRGIGQLAPCGDNVVTPCGEATFACTGCDHIPRAALADSDGGE